MFDAFYFVSVLSWIKEVVYQMSRIWSLLKYNFYEVNRTWKELLKGKIIIMH